MKSALDFDRFMNAVVQVPKDKIDKALDKAKSKRRRAKLGTPSPSRDKR
jgi:carbamoylphosphate synthase large subunit